ncbi:MAG: hypothetical protein ABIG93_05010 [archaeon]|nr:hypothetical protein [Nanoarchaeota archaeon]
MNGIAAGLGYDNNQLPQMRYDTNAQNIYLKDSLYNSQPELERTQVQKDSLTDSIARVVGNIQKAYFTQEDTENNTVYDIAQSSDTVDAIVSSAANDVPTFSSQVVNEVSEFIDSIVAGTDVSDVTYDNNQDQSNNQPINVYVVLNELGAQAYATDQEAQEDEQENLTVVNLKEDLAVRILEELEEVNEQQHGVHNHQYAHDQLLGEQLMLYH